MVMCKEEGLSWWDWQRIKKEGDRSEEKYWAWEKYW